jgi:hypothetical protein
MPWGHQPMGSRGKPRLRMDEPTLRPHNPRRRKERPEPSPLKPIASLVRPVYATKRVKGLKLNETQVFGPTCALDGRKSLAVHWSKG